MAGTFELGEENILWAHDLKKNADLAWILVVTNILVKKLKVVKIIM